MTNYPLMASYHFENHCTAPETVQTLRQDHFVKSRADISKLAQMAKDILWVPKLGTDIPSLERISEMGPGVDF